MAVENSSIDLIFRSRRIDYFTETYDEEVVERTLNLVAADQHDFILAYQQEYDDKMHATVPRSQRPCARWPTTYATSIASLARGARPVGNHVTRRCIRVRSRHAHRSIDGAWDARQQHGGRPQVRLFWGVHFPV